VTEMQLAEELYNTYHEAYQEVSFDVIAILPKFKDADPKARECWKEVARAVTNMVLNGSFNYLYFEPEDL